MKDATPPLVSVVTPVRNGEAFLSACLESVGGKMEHWVIDGGSTDGTLGILSRPGPHRWVSEPDRGQADAVNKGWRLSSGEILGWLNADDLYETGALVEIRRFFAENPGADGVYGDAAYVDAKGDLIGRYPTRPWSLRRLRRFCFIPQPAMFLRRRVLDRFGPLDDRLHYCMDYEYWLRIAGEANVRYLSRTLARVRIHAGMKTVRNRRAAHEEIVRMLHARTGRVAALWIVGLAAAQADEEAQAGNLPDAPRPYTERVIHLVRESLRRLPVTGSAGLRLRMAAWRARARKGRSPFRLSFPHPPALAGHVFGGVRFG